MNWLDKIERKCGRIAVPNLMFFIICGMFAVFLCELIMPELRLTYWMYLDRDLIFQGQVWRLLTFILIPTSTSPVSYTHLDVYKRQILKPSALNRNSR